MATNAYKASKEVVDKRIRELLWCARGSGATEVKFLPDGIEITVNNLIPSALMRAAVSLQDCFPNGGAYVVSREGRLVLCVYRYKEA